MRYKTEQDALAKLSRGNATVDGENHSINGHGCGKDTWGAIDYLVKHHHWRYDWGKPEGFTRDVKKV